MGEGIELPKFVRQKLSARSPCRLWLRNCLGTIQQLVDLTSEPRTDDPQTEKRGGRSFVWPAAARFRRRDIVILNRRRPAESK